MLRVSDASVFWIEVNQAAADNRGNRSAFHRDMARMGFSVTELLMNEPLATAHTTGSSRSALTPVTCCALRARSSPSTPAVFFAASWVIAATSSAAAAGTVVAPW